MKPLFGSYTFAQALTAYHDRSWRWPVWVDNRGHHWIEDPSGMVRCIIDDRSAGLATKSSIDHSFLGPLRPETAPLSGEDVQR